MPKQPSNSSDVLKQLQLDRNDWELLKQVCDVYRVSRTEAVKRSIKVMIRDRVVPGFKPIGESHA